MINRLMIAGFGGQGVMMIGKLIGECAMEQGLYATFFPSYGAEQRGGTANCTVIQSDRKMCIRDRSISGRSAMGTSASL